MKRRLSVHKTCIRTLTEDACNSHRPCRKREPYNLFKFGLFRVIWFKNIRQNDVLKSWIEGKKGL